MAKNPSTVASAPGAEAVPAYEVVGLQKADSMPIEFEGRTYDLASLTPEQANYLLQQGDKVPYLKAVGTTPTAPTE